MAWGDPETKSAKGSETMFIKIEEGKAVTARIAVEEATKRVVHKIMEGSKVSHYINCPGYATCPICKMPKEAKGDKIQTQTRYFIPVLNRTTGKFGIIDLPKTPKEEIDMIAKQAGDPRNYDIIFSRIGINTKVMFSPNNTPISQEDIDTVNSSLAGLDLTKFTTPWTPEEIRKVLDEMHQNFKSANVVPDINTAAAQTPGTPFGGAKASPFGASAGAGVPNSAASNTAEPAKPTSPFTASAAKPNPNISTTTNNGASAFNAKSNTSIDDKLFG
jgi:hypothetical protein